MKKNKLINKFAKSIFSVFNIAFIAITCLTLTTGSGSLHAQTGGPILVITSASNPFTGYYAEILRTEGFNSFTVSDISLVTAGTLSNYDVAILGEMALNDSQVTMLSNWVNAGGNLIAMRPDKTLPSLLSLLGLTNLGTTLSDAYLLVNTTSGPGQGIVNQTIQFHGTADRYSTSATTVATLYSDATTSTSSPAVTLRSVGSSGGQTAAFTYDLAKSVVYTRQGNPAWAGQERDGVSPIRSDDLFYPDWIDLDKVAIPQADEQQRLLANLIIQMNYDKKPLPRFWYFPRGLKAAVIMTSDNHGVSDNAAARFESYIDDSPTGCSVEDWECIRATAYIETDGGMTPTQAAAYNAMGFEIALHVSTGCLDFTPS
ncbi:MAG: Ig-like domain-containing protein, partial [Syntrophales bacterium]